MSISMTGKNLSSKKLHGGEQIYLEQYEVQFF